MKSPGKDLANSRFQVESTAEQMIQLYHECSRRKGPDIIYIFPFFTIYQNLIGPQR